MARDRHMRAAGSHAARRAHAFLSFAVIRTECDREMWLLARITSEVLGFRHSAWTTF